MVSPLLIFIILNMFCVVKSFQFSPSKLRLRAMTVSMAASTTIAPCSLSVNDIAARYKVIQYGQDGSASSFEMENQDTKYAIELVKVDVCRDGGLGLDLAEFDTTRGKGGIVLINSIIPGSNADKAGKFMPGDALVCISAREIAGTHEEQMLAGIPQGDVRVEGLNFDATINEIGRFRDVADLSITVKRLVVREYVNIEMVGPQNEDAGAMVIPAGYAANMRTELQRQNMKMYDSRTARFDSPYETGDCGGEGTCGTCTVNIISGKEFLNERTNVEEKAMLKMGAPASWRWACRTKLRPGVNKGGKVKIMLRPQTREWK
jgi:hypothetical protein